MGVEFERLEMDILGIRSPVLSELMSSIAELCADAFVLFIATPCECI